MATFRVHWTDNPGDTRGYYTDVDADGEAQAAWQAAFNAQPGATFGAVTPATPQQ